MYPDTRPPFERTGAGDAFASSVTAALAMGRPLEEALLWGPINSMSVVQEVGAQKGLLSREKLEEFLKNAPVEYRLQNLQ
jgi:sugar/nucleoside kinase (ribokinase family)